MNSFEKTIVVLLFVMLIAWGFYQRMFAPPAPPPGQGEEIGEVQPGSSTNAAGQVSVVATGGVGVAEIKQGNAVVESNAVETVASASPVLPEKLVTLTNSQVTVTLSSWGGGIKEVELKEYRESVETDSPPVILDFHDKPAFSLVGIAGMDKRSSFEVTVDGSGTNATVTAVASDGLQLIRRLTLHPGYVLKVSDTFTGPEGMKTLPRYGMNLGPMRRIKSKARTRGISYLGLDTLADQAGSEVVHWGKKEVPALFGYKRSFLSCAKQDTSSMPEDVSKNIEMPIAWGAAKNKFFAQILAPEGGAVDCELYAERSTNATSALTMTSVSSTLFFPGREVSSGESYTREMSYYVGPKKQSLLKDLGNRQADVMQFGWWAWFRWVCTVLITTLNAIYGVLPNYGVAIIILTILVKILFWPLTHKSTESSKKMQKLQPLIAELKEKHKDQPQKMQQAQMALYKEHGVNPLASCLPMLVQLPIFIALFTVLRSSIELRFANFLWIADLSEPEGLLAGMIPIIGSLNILPIVMTATMIMQQQLTPTTGDPQQKKMMMMMPAMMLLFFYNMASALVLYWSVSQCLSIVQLLMQRRKSKQEAGG
ncbi:MAG: membrane protein insertase YidC [Kiritimatiellia bacterium]|jgi:YidC/Oxa1 family membrane protein insertase|nr:membrane protein insertase YidC [Kiritimatiellia bacterium]